MLDRGDDGDPYRDDDDDDVGGQGFLRTPWGREPVDDGGKSVQHGADSGASGGFGRPMRTAVTVVGALMLAAALVLVGPRLSHSSSHNMPAVHRCIDNSACNELSLVGNCCPTPEGKLLGCCTANDNLVTRHPTSKAACASNSACAAIGLVGDCCPTVAGTRLGCCDAKDNEVMTFIASALCADNAACGLEGLTGNCCPTDDGAMLGCCPAEVVRPKGH